MPFFLLPGGLSPILIHQHSFLLQIEAGHLRHENTEIFTEQIRRIVVEAQKKIADGDMKPVETSQGKGTEAKPQVSPDAAGNKDRSSSASCAVESNSNAASMTEIDRRQSAPELKAQAAESNSPRNETPSNTEMSQNAVEDKSTLQGSDSVKNASTQRDKKEEVKKLESQKEPADSRKTSDGQKVTEVPKKVAGEVPTEVKVKESERSTVSQEVKREASGTQQKDEGPPTAVAKKGRFAVSKSTPKLKELDSGHEKVVDNSKKDEGSSERKASGERKLSTERRQSGEGNKPLERKLSDESKSKLNSSEKLVTEQQATVKTEIHSVGNKSPEVKAMFSLDSNEIKLVGAESVASEVKFPGGVEANHKSSKEEGTLGMKESVASPVEKVDLSSNVAPPGQPAAKGRFHVKQVAPPVKSIPSVASDESLDGNSSQSAAKVVESQVTAAEAQKPANQPQAHQPATPKHKNLSRSSSNEDKNSSKSDLSDNESKARKAEPETHNVRLPQPNLRSQTSSPRSTLTQPFFRVGSSDEVDEAKVTNKRDSPGGSPRKCMSPVDYNKHGPFESADQSSKSALSDQEFFAFANDITSDRAVPPDLISDTSSVASSCLDSPGVTPSLTPSSSFENLLNLQENTKISRTVQSSSQTSERVPYERSTSRNVSTYTHLLVEVSFASGWYTFENWFL